MAHDERWAFVAVGHATEPLAGDNEQGAQARLDRCGAPGADARRVQQPADRLRWPVPFALRVGRFLPCWRISGKGNAGTEGVRASGRRDPNLLGHFARAGLRSRVDDIL